MSASLPEMKMQELSPPEASNTFKKIVDNVQIRQNALSKKRKIGILGNVTDNRSYQNRTSKQKEFDLKTQHISVIMSQMANNRSVKLRKRNEIQISPQQSLEISNIGIPGIVDLHSKISHALLASIISLSEKLSIKILSVRRFALFLSHIGRSIYLM